MNNMKKLLLLLFISFGILNSASAATKMYICNFEMAWIQGYKITNYPIQTLTMLVNKKKIEVTMPMRHVPGEYETIAYKVVSNKNNSFLGRHIVATSKVMNNLGISSIVFRPTDSNGNIINLFSLSLVSGHNAYALSGNCKD
jgi:hypothetical protein